MAYNPDKRHDDCMKKIDKIFEIAKQEGYTFGPNSKKDRLDDGTYETYCRKTKEFFGEIYEKYGEADITRVTPEQFKELFDEKIAAGESAYTLRQLPHVLEAFRQASGKSGVYKSEINVCDKKEALQTLDKNDIFRRAEDSTHMKATPEDGAKVREAILSSISPIKEVVADINAVQEGTGGRITAMMKLEVKDIDFENNTVTFVKDKGGLTRTVEHIDEKTMEILKQYCFKKDGTPKSEKAPVFQIKNHHGDKRGKDMKDEDAVDAIDRVVKTAAENAGVNKKDKFYTPHSSRKTFAQNRMNEYAKLSDEELKREIDRRIEEDEKKSKDEKSNLDEKYKGEIKNINNKRKSGSRDMNHKEMCTWLTSVDLGHGRNSVVRFYADYPGDLSNTEEEDSDSYGFDSADLDIQED